MALDINTDEYFLGTVSCTADKTVFYRSVTPRCVAKETMHPNPIVKQLIELVAQRPPDGLTGRAQQDAHKTLSKRCRYEAHLLGAETRATLLAEVIDYVKKASPGEVERSLLVNVWGLLEMDFSLTDFSEFEAVPGLVSEEITTTRSISYSVFEGQGVAPTALLRTSIFNDTKVDNKTRVFEVLGLNNTCVEREGKPLGQNHLQALVYLLGKVVRWTNEGTTVKFSAWDAVRVLGKGANSKTVKNLKNTLEDLQGTRIRLVHDTANATEESAPLVGRLLTSLDKGKMVCWEVQLTSTLLDAIAKHRTFLDLNTLAVIPMGVTTWLYGYIASQPKKETEWDLDALAERAGLMMPWEKMIETGESPTSQQVKTRVNENRRKIQAALELLKKGVVISRPRGICTHHEGRGEIVHRINRKTKEVSLAVKSTTTTTKLFEPVLADWSFRKTKDGKLRVQIVKKTKAKDAPNIDAFLKKGNSQQ